MRLCWWAIGSYRCDGIDRGGGGCGFAMGSYSGRDGGGRGNQLSELPRGALRCGAGMLVGSASSLPDTKPGSRPAGGAAGGAAAAAGAECWLRGPRCALAAASSDCGGSSPATRAISGPSTLARSAACCACGRCCCDVDNEAGAAPLRRTPERSGTAWELPPTCEAARGTAAGGVAATRGPGTSWPPQGSSNRSGNAAGCTAAECSDTGCCRCSGAERHLPAGSAAAPLPPPALKPLPRPPPAIGAAGDERHLLSAELPPPFAGELPGVPPLRRPFCHPAVGLPRCEAIGGCSSNAESAAGWRELHCDARKARQRDCLGKNKMHLRTLGRRRRGSGCHAQQHAARRVSSVPPRADPAARRPLAPAAPPVPAARLHCSESAM